MKIFTALKQENARILIHMFKNRIEKSTEIYTFE